MDDSKTKKIIPYILKSGGKAKIKDITEFLSTDSDTITSLIPQLSDSLNTMGLNLNYDDTEIIISPLPNIVSDLEEPADNIEDSLTPALRETLTVILYTAPASKEDVDFIRGVDARYALRKLKAMDLITTKTEEDQSTYHPTGLCFSRLGIDKADELDNYEDIRKTCLNLVDKLNAL